MTNRDFAERDPIFRAACEAAKLPPTMRQASKWLNKTGKAWLLYCRNHRNGNGMGIDMRAENRNT